MLYWQIGRDILARQNQAGWGAKIIDQLSKDLHHDFPEVQGFSPRNLKYMRAFAEAWPDELIVQQLVAQIPWGHNVRILDHVKDPAEREWYARQTVENGWSRNVLVIHIEAGLFRQQGKAQTNFKQTLPAHQSDLAQQLLKDPYNFDFLTLAQEAHEKDLESGLLVNIRKVFLELGVGFSFVGAQYPLEIGGEDFKIDLLFYHLKLRCFVVIDLKMGAFKPEYAGKMNFYLSAWTISFGILTTSPVLVSSSVKVRTALSPSMPSVTCRNRLGSRNSVISKNYQTNSKGRFQPSQNWRPSSRKVPIVTRLMTMFQP